MTVSKELAVLISGRDSGASQSLRQLKGDLSGLEGASKSAASGLEGASKSAASGFAGLASGAAKLGLGVFGIQQLAGAVGGLTSSIVGGNAEMERYSVQFGVLFKSAGAARDRIAELQKFNLATPFQLPELVQADKVLTGFGLHSAEAAKAFGKSGSEIRTIAADVAAGTGASMQDMATYIGRFASGATGEAMMRFAELGVVTRGELQQMGVEFDKAGSLTSPISEAMSALLTVMQDKFGGMAVAQSQTFEGMQSNIEDWITQSKNTLSKPIFDVLKEGMSDTLKALSDPAWGSSIENLANAFREGLYLGIMPAIETVAAGIMALPRLLDRVSAAVERGAAELRARLGVTGTLEDFLTAGKEPGQPGVLTPLLEGVGPFLGRLGRAGEVVTGGHPELETTEEINAWIATQQAPAPTNIDKWRKIIAGSAATPEASKALYGPPIPSEVDQIKSAWDTTIREISESKIASESKGQFRLNLWRQTQDAQELAAANAPKGGGPKYFAPPPGGAGEKGETADQSVARAKKFRDEMKGFGKEADETAFEVGKAGEKAGKEWIASWDKANTAIKDEYQKAETAVRDAAEQEMLSRRVRGQRQEFQEAQAQQDLARSRNREDYDLQRSYERELAALQSDSFQQRQQTAQTERTRAQQDYDEQRSFERELAALQSDSFQQRQQTAQTERARRQQDYDEQRSFERDVAALQMDSFQQRMGTEATFHSRAQQDEYNQWMLQRQLAKAKPEERAGIMGQAKESQEVTAFQRGQQDEDRAWQLAQDKKVLEERRRQTAADLAEKRGREDEDRAWQIDQDRKALEERRKQELADLAEKRGREDEDRAWHIDQERAALAEKRKQELADLAENRTREDDDLAWRKSQELDRQVFEDGLRDDELKRQRQRINDERDAKITAINEEWKERQITIAMEKELTIRAAKEGGLAKLETMKAAAFEWIDTLKVANDIRAAYRAEVEAKVASESEPLRDQFAGVDEEHRPGGRIFETWRVNEPEQFATWVRERNIPGYASGGIVAGPIGMPRLAVVHGGETVTPAGNGGGRAVNINVYGNTMLADSITTARELARILKPEIDRVTGGGW